MAHLSAISPSDGSSAPKRVRFTRSPEAVLDRYTNSGERWFFPSGDLAFVNHGDRLTTKSENEQVIRDMVAITRENNAQTVIATGTESFRRIAWREATRIGLELKGYKPTPQEQRGLAQRMATDAARLNNTSPNQHESSNPRTDTAESLDRSYFGKLLSHGRETYRRDPHADLSYFIKLETSQGPVELWGKDLERALKQSKSRPEPGDDIIIRQTGQKAVTVSSMVRDEFGAPIGEREKRTQRNTWLIEKSDFFKERVLMADTVRDPAITPKQAAERHPPLTGTAFVLKKLEEAAKTVSNPQIRADFYAAARTWLANEIARGEPLRTTKIKRSLLRTGVREPLRPDPRTQ